MKAADLLKGIPKLRVLVVGDLCLDQWCYYDPALAIPSAETGIPRIAVVHSHRTPGAAGTVASNLKSLGVSQVSILSLIGDDCHAHELLRVLQQNDISSELIL